MVIVDQLMCARPEALAEHSGDIMLRNGNGFEVGRLAAPDALRTALQRGH